MVSQNSLMFTSAGPPSQPIFSGITRGLPGNYQGITRGLLGIAREFAKKFTDSLGLIACKSITVFVIFLHGVVMTCTCFFSEVPPFEIISRLLLVNY